MSDPVTIIGTIAVGYAVSKLTEKITGSETLGMIAGLAAGGWAGTAISGYMAASAVPAVAGAATAPGSALGVAGAAPLGGAAAGAVPAAGSPIAAQALSAGPGAAAAIPGAAAAAPAAPAAASGGGFFSGFDPNEVLKVAASGLSGMAKSKEREKDREVEKDYLKLRESEFEEDKRRYYAQGAYGVTNDGRVVPINAGGQLQAMNQRLGFQPHTSSGTMTNINAVPRDDGGYLASFGRFGGTNA